ncbi:MAG: hypothetical protein AB7U62_20935 [Pseudolabrys sp.]
MSFDIVAITKNTKQPASVVLSDRADTGLPKCRISFTKDFVEQAGIKAGDRFELAIGSGEHAGLARLRRDRTGALAPVIGPRGTAFFDCGHVARFGTEPEKKQPCKADLVDADTILIRLPSWASEGADA